MLHRIVRGHFWIAAVLAAIVLCTGLIGSTRVAAGSDAYGYVSQVDLWLRGDLHVDQSFGARRRGDDVRWRPPRARGHDRVAAAVARVDRLSAAEAVASAP